MRLIETILAMGIMVIFIALASGMILNGMNLYKETCRIEYGLSRDRFLKDGFLMMCSQLNEVNEKNRDGWYVKSAEWKQMCHSMWRLENLELEITNEGFRQTWVVDGKTMGVTYRLNGGSDFGFKEK